MRLRRRARPRPRRAAGQALVRRAVLPRRAPAAGPLPAAAAGRHRGHRGRRSGPRRRGDRARGRGVPLARADAVHAPAHLTGLRGLPPRLPRAPAGVPGHARPRRGHARSARRSTRCASSTTSAPTCRRSWATRPSWSTTCARTARPTTTPCADSCATRGSPGPRRPVWCAASTTTPAPPSSSSTPLLGAQSGIGGGGRYDGLMESIGGASLVGHRLGHRHGSHPAGLSGRGARARGRARGRRLHRGHRVASTGGDHAADDATCAPAVCGSTWRTATRASRPR